MVETTEALCAARRSESSRARRLTYVIVSIPALFTIPLSTIHFLNVAGVGGRTTDSCSRSNC